MRGYLSAVENIAHFGLGRAKMIDTVRIEWTSGQIQEKYRVKANQTLIFEENTKNTASKHSSNSNKKYFEAISPQQFGVDYSHQENFYNDFKLETLLPYKQSTLGPFLAIADVNNDQKDDIFIGGASGQAATLLIQTQRGFMPKEIPAFANNHPCEDMEAVFFDYDQDGDQDLYVVSGGNEHLTNSPFYADRLYLNDGKGNFTQKNDPVIAAQQNSGKSVCILDFDKDGLQDIALGNRIVPQHYPKSAPSKLYKNTTDGLLDVTAEVIPDFENFGIINQMIATDFNADGWTDIIAVGEWTTIGLFKNDKGKFVNITENTGLQNEKGWWLSIQETDLNNDQLPDYIIGNLGLNSKYKASKEKPLKVYAHDFDQNKTWDVVLSQVYKDKYVPLRGRQCSSEQMPFIKDKFPTFDSFAKASLKDVYGEKLDEAYHVEANTFASIVLINRGNEQFQQVELPIEAQMSPVLSCISRDLNGDNYDDLILGGNIYNTEVETPRLDAGSGVVLISNQKDNYQALPNYKQVYLWKAISKI